MSSTADRGLADLYDDLSRYQWTLRRLRRTRDGLAMRKRLGPARAPDRPAAGTDDLSRWLGERLAPGPGARLLDLGAGFGALAFDWLERRPAASAVGLSLSGYQVRRARAEAARRGLQARAEFRRQSYAEPIAGRFEAIAAIEALFHAADLPAVLRNAAGALAEGGRIGWIEDMASDRRVAASAEGRLLCERWSTRTLHTAEDYAEAARAAGLAIVERVDLGEQVVVGSAARLRASEVRLRRLARVAPSARIRRVLRAFEGGVALERLYAAGQMRYLAMVAEVRPRA